MKNRFALIIMLLLCSSCSLSKGVRTGDACRPKNPNFKILTTPFTKTEKIDFSKTYIVDNATNAKGLKFYEDGRMILCFSADGFKLKQSDIDGRTWENAKAVGYWRATKTTISIEYFVCNDLGHYVMQEGEIHNDTITFSKGKYNAGGKEVFIGF